MLEMDTERLLRTANAELTLRITQLEAMVLERQKEHGSLLDSEKRYRRLFESAKDGILILDADTGRVVDVNPFLLRILGYSYGAVQGQFIWELGAFKDIAASKEAFKKLQDNEYIRYEDLPLESLSGQLIAVEFISNVYLVDHMKVIQCNIRDITQRKRADAERRRLLAAIEQTSEAIIMTDVHGEIQFVNPAFVRSSGYSREEALGQNARFLKSGAHDEAFYGELRESLRTGTTWMGQLVSKRKDGTLYTEEITISPVRDAALSIVNYVAVKRDVTAVLRLSAQYQQAQKMESVGLMVGGVAHDYNNMLSVILGYADLARSKVALTDPLRSDLDRVCQAAMRSAEITRQLLIFARKQSVTPVLLNLNQTVESLIKMLRRLIGENISLAWLPDKAHSLVKMDSVQINQILANLCINARDAITDVGKITIETGVATFDQNYCDCHAGYAPGHFVMLAVSDDGCGMGKQTLDQIFEPFFTTKAPDRGTGLGLSTVYEIVRNADGFITVYSEPDEGTTFKIYLPLHADATQAPAISAQLELPRGHGETLLVVEDEPTLLAVMQNMLEQLDYRVITASAPHEAFRLGKAHRTELRLLVTDVVMPDMNGRELSDRLQALTPGLKTLFMSGYTANVIFERGIREGVPNFLEKPFSIGDLASKIRDALNPPSP